MNKFFITLLGLILFSTTSFSAEDSKVTMNESQSIKIAVVDFQRVLTESGIGKDYIKNADLLIHPTKKESFGLVLVESMALGTPIAASSYEAIPEILKKTNSILFNPNSEIEIKESVIKFLNLSDLEKKIMIKKGKERSKDFSQENRTNKMISLYDKIQKLY